MIPSQYIQNDNARTLVGTLRPSGRFSVCATFPKKSKVLNHGKVQKQDDSTLLTVQQLDVNYSSLVNGARMHLQSVCSHSPETPGVLGLSIATNSRIRARRGSKGISARQRDLLCWGANVLERVYGRANLSFLTLTLPDLSARDFDSVRENWSAIVNRTVEQIKRKLESHGIKSSVVGCSELQMERAEASGRYYPHLHLVFRGRISTHSHWAIEPSGFREIWRTNAGRFLSDPVDTWKASENVQRVNKSVGGYLAKYISKCASKSDSNCVSLWHPSDWILVSRRIRGLYEQFTRKGYEVGRALLDVVNNWRSGMGYKQPIIISTPVFGDRTIGQWGWLKGEFISPCYAEIHPC